MGSVKDLKIIENATENKPGIGQFYYIEADRFVCQKRRGAMRLNGKDVIPVIVIVFCLLFNGTYGYEDLFTPQAKAFLATPEGGGEQNALSNYVRAMERFDT